MGDGGEQPADDEQVMSDGLVTGTGKEIGEGGETSAVTETVAGEERQSFSDASLGMGGSGLISNTSRAILWYGEVVFCLCLRATAPP